MDKKNGYPPKVELQLNEAIRLKILRPVKTGGKSTDPYYLYRVINLDTGEEQSLFAPAEVHSVIQENKLGVGSEFLLKRVQNGKNGNSKLELSILGKASDTPNMPAGDNLREVLLNCIHDADYVAKNSGLQFSLDEIQKLATTLFIARSKAY